ncbi:MULTISPECIES: cation-transporting P-type ATPase [unclassified Ornithinimicrobium]
MTTQEAAERLRRDGPNELRAPPRSRPGASWSVARGSGRTGRPPRPVQ